MHPVREALTQGDWARMSAEGAPPLLALWADSREAYALLHDTGGPRLLSVAVEEGRYPALSPARPAAAWYERMVHDLWGHTAVGAADLRPWLDHGHWPHAASMAARPGLSGVADPPDFPALDGLDQVPVGPVQGKIGPAAHMRLGVRGETIARMEIRLGYTHKGTLALMRGKSPRAAARFAARLAGETTVAHAIAFARATEAALASEVTLRATALRGVMAEIERITRHLDVLASIAETMEFRAMAGWCARHCEAIRVAVNVAFGHRLMMDCVIPGGLAADIVPGGAEAVVRALVPLAADLPKLQARHFIGAAAGAGTVGERHAAHYPSRTGTGDVVARTQLRMTEIGEAIRVVRNRLASLPEGPCSVALLPESGEGLGYGAGPDGDIWHWLRLDHGQIASVFMRDPAWVHWPLVEAVMAEGSVDDLALVLASFGLSASGADL